MGHLLLTLACGACLVAAALAQDVKADMDSKPETTKKHKTTQEVKVKTALKPSPAAVAPKPSKKDLKRIKHQQQPQEQPYDTISYSSASPQGDLGGGQQPSFVLDNGRRFEVRHTPFGQPSALGAAIGAISAHLLSQGGAEYIPYPPNGNPAHYPPYRGNLLATQPPLIASYERANNLGYGYYPTARQFYPAPQYLGFGNPGAYFHPDFYPGHFGFFPNTNFADAKPEVGGYGARRPEAEELDRKDGSKDKEPIKRWTG